MGKEEGWRTTAEWKKKGSELWKEERSERGEGNRRKVDRERRGRKTKRDTRETKRRRKMNRRDEGRRRWSTARREGGKKRRNWRKGYLLDKKDGLRRGKWKKMG